MNKEIARYCRILKGNLHCGRAKRQEILGSFEYTLSGFMEECQNPTYTQLTDAFGPPEEMARVLMESVTAEEQRRYRKKRIILKTLMYAVLMLFAVFAIYIFFDKEYSVIIIYDELVPVQTMIGLRGYWK